MSLSGSMFIPDRPLLFIQPSRPITASLGQRLRVDLYFASNRERVRLRGLIFEVAGSEAEHAGQFSEDPLNSQHVLFEVTVRPALRGDNRFLYNSSRGIIVSANLTITVTSKASLFE